MALPRSTSIALASVLAALVVAGTHGYAHAQKFRPPQLVSNSVTGLQDSGDDYDPSLSTDGDGHWVAVWQSYDDLGGTNGGDGDIVVARSSDNGATWTNPVALNSNAGTDDGFDYSVNVACDGGDVCIAVWTSDDDLGGTIGNDEDILFAVSGDDGATWSATAALNTNAASDSGSDARATVVSGGAGDWIAVWTSNEDLGGTIGTDNDILVARSTDNGATWSAPAALATDAASDNGNDDTPRLAGDGAGNWVAVWASTDDLGGTIGTEGDLRAATSTDDGATWSAPVVLNSYAVGDPYSDWTPDIATDADGNWIAVWRANEDVGGLIGNEGDILYAVSTDTGANWTAAAPLNTNAATDFGGDFDPRITHGSGKWTVVWTSYDDLGGTIGSDEDMLVASSTDDGATWSAVAPIASNAATDELDDFWPAIATDAAGNWVVAWYSDETLGSTIGQDYDILTVRSSDNASTWSAVGPLNNNATTDAEVDRDPAIAAGSDGRWVAVWESRDTLGGTIGDDLDILVSTSSDDGVTWSAPAALNSFAAIDDESDQDPAVVAVGPGNWIVAWESNQDLGGTTGNDGDLMFSRSTDNGVTWSAATPLNIDATFDTDFDADVRLATDGSGRLIAVWESSNDNGGTTGGDDEIRFARSTDGGATWSSPASLNTNAATDFGYDTNAAIATDRDGAWMVAWTTEDDLGGTIGTDGDIVFARSTDNGVTWSDPAPVNSDAASDFSFDSDPSISTDGNGRWMIAWDVELASDLDIFFATSTNDGATWSTQAPLNSRSGVDVRDDADVSLVADASGTWMAVWESRDDLGGLIGDEGDILYAVSTDGGATWSDQDAVSTRAAIDGDQDDDDPRVATDGNGRWITVWESEDDLGGIASRGVDDVVAAVAGPCDPEPVATLSCLAAPSTKMLVSSSATPGKSKLLWQWGKGAAFDQTDLGAPLADTRYALCLYDSSSSAPYLLSEFVIAPSSTRWVDKDPKGLLYKDAAGTSDGVTKMLVKPGATGATTVKLLARGSNLVLPPAAGATYFEQDPSVVAQLVTSTGTCWTTEFDTTDNKKHDAARFLALTK